MTPRKELFIKVKEALKNVEGLELIDLYRKQFEDGSPNEWTAALIRINTIEWETMTQNKQEGKCTIDVLFYCKDGWMDQHQKTADPDHGLIEIDIQDQIVEELQFLSGDQFKPLQQIDDETEEQDIKGVMSYRQGFSTLLYRKINPAFQSRKLTLNP